MPLAACHHSNSISDLAPKCCSFHIVGFHVRIDHRFHPSNGGIAQVGDQFGSDQNFVSHKHKAFFALIYESNIDPAQFTRAEQRSRVLEMCSARSRERRWLLHRPLDRFSRLMVGFGEGFARLGKRTHGFAFQTDQLQD